MFKQACNLQRKRARAETTGLSAGVQRTYIVPYFQHIEPVCQMFSNKPFLISRHEPCLVEGRHSNLQLIHRRQPVAVRKHSCNPHKSHLGSIPFPLSDSSEASSQPSCTEEAQPSPTPAPPTPALPENAEPLFTSSFDHRGAVRVAATAALVYTLIGSRVPNAHALVVDEDREWKPRRHHRRLDERVSNTWAADAVEVRSRIETGMMHA